MVAIGRALLSNPRLLLCDEISLGLAPRSSSAKSTRASRRSSADGTALVLVEQDVVPAPQPRRTALYCLLEGRVDPVRQSARR